MLRCTPRRASPFRQVRSLQSSGLQGRVSKEEILSLPSTPLMSPSYPRGPYTFYNREYFIIKYETDPDALRSVVPSPLVPRPPGNVVLYEWISMPDSTGFGAYQESGTVIPCINTVTGEAVNYTAQMYLDCEPPIAAGREIWGFPKKYAHPEFKVVRDTVVGRLEYAGQLVAQGSMSYKFEEINPKEALQSLTATQVNLKVIPDVDWSPRLCRLVGYNLTNVNLKGAWKSPARLHLEPHINCPVADMPVRKVLGGTHYLADITLPYGRIIHDYLRSPRQGEPANPAFPEEKVLQTVSMPAVAPSYHEGPVSLTNRKYFIVEYRTDMEALRRVVPSELYVNPEARVLAMWINTEGTGLGDYHKFDLLVPVEDAEGNKYHYGLINLVDSSAPITGGREVWGQPQKYGLPQLNVVRDSINGVVEYSDRSTVAKGSMTYKHFKMAKEVAAGLLSIPEINLKLIPDVNGHPEIAQLVALNHSNVNVHKAWEGPARLQLIPHANAPFADLPVREILRGYNIIGDVELPAGRVVHDYLKSN